VGLVKHDEIGRKIDTFTHHIVEMVPQDLSGPHHNRGIRVLLAITRQYSNAFRAKAIRKLRILGIRKRL
jgi:hypothetical protein